MSQNASPFPHLGQSTWVFGSVSVRSSRTSMSPGRSSRRTTRAVRASLPVIPRSYPHFWQRNLPSEGNNRELHFGQNMWESVGLVPVLNSFRLVRPTRSVVPCRWFRGTRSARAGGRRGRAVRADRRGFGRRALRLPPVRRFVLLERPL